jgi:hypothetical protein
LGLNASSGGLAAAVKTLLEKLMMRRSWREAMNVRWTIGNFTRQRRDVGALLVAMKRFASRRCVLIPRAIVPTDGVAVRSLDLSRDLL